MYTDRVCAFVDLLGFGNLVERSAGDPDRARAIYATLESLQPDALTETMYASINHDVVPPEELEGVKKAARMMAKAMSKDAEIRISYFSDNIFLSCDADNILATQVLVNRLAELSVTMWTEHGILLRGGIARGELVHMPNGPVFGPALLCAYQLESKIAKHPRILIDQSCLEHFRKADTFNLLESMFEPIADFSYLSLATALRFRINDSTLVLGPPANLIFHMKVFDEAADLLGAMKEAAERDDVKDKYRWLIGDFAQRSAEIKRRKGLVEGPC